MSSLAVCYHRCCGYSVTSCELLDRRVTDPAGGPVMRRWIFQLDLERVLYGNEASTGAALKARTPRVRGRLRAHAAPRVRGRGARH